MAVKMSLVDLALLVAVLGVAVSLQGCETAMQKATRLSCAWPGDMGGPVGCDQSAWNSCITNCEYCIFKMGTVQAGRMDDCAQLKCAAYCAKRDSANCVATYQPLCEDAKSNALQSTCNVNCSPARRSTSHSMALSIGLVLMATFWGIGPEPAGGTSQKPTGQKWNKAVTVVLLVAAIFCSSTLQGCGYCASIQPTLPWQVDLAPLDVAAGCDNQWNPWFGNPCASDVPILWAKKGVYAKDTSDINWVNSQVSNKDYVCLQKNGTGYCGSWVRGDPRCDWQNLGICTCETASPGNSYCSAWRCVTKKVEQKMCWIERTENGDTIACGKVGSNFRPLDYGGFMGLLAQEQTIRALSTNRRDALGILRSAYSGQYYSNGECIVSRQVTDITQVTCQSWRMIQTELQFCNCTQADSQGRYCQKWSCENSQMGPFSVLFAGSRSYSNVISGQLLKLYECTLEVVTGQSTAICGAYYGNSNGYSQVNQFLCQRCSNAGPECDRWTCNEYALDRIQDFDQYGKRLGFCILHWLWMSIVLLFFGIACLLTAPEGQEGNSAGVCCFTGCLAVSGCIVASTLIWSIAFARYTDFGWRRPLDPFLGLLVMTLPACVVAAALNAILANTDLNWFPKIVLPFTMFMISLTWTNGFAASLVVFGIIGLPFLCCFCANAKKYVHPMGRKLEVQKWDADAAARASDCPVTMYSSDNAGQGWSNDAPQT